MQIKLRAELSSESRPFLAHPGARLSRGRAVRVERRLGRPGLDRVGDPLGDAVDAGADRHRHDHQAEPGQDRASGVRGEDAVADQQHPHDRQRDVRLPLGVHVEHDRRQRDEHHGRERQGRAELQGPGPGLSHPGEDRHLVGPLEHAERGERAGGQQNET